MTAPRTVVRVLSAWLVIASPAHADATDDFIRAEMKRQNIPGLAVAIVKNGKIVKAQGYGLADRERAAPVTTETVFKIGSVSKQFIAAGVMLLVRDGRLSLGEPASRYLIGAPPSWSAITIRHLLNHTAGLIREPPAFTATELQPVETLVASAYATPLRFAPGDRWEYSNTGYNVLAAIITRVSGQPWDQFIAARVFAPAGLRSTRLTTTQPFANRAFGYSDNERLVRAEDWLAVRPGGAFMSTVLDLARWDAVLYTDAVLDAATRREMWTALTLNDGASHPYGLGWYVSRPGQRRQVFHGGGLPGFIAQFRRYLDDRVTVIVLMNLDDVDDETIANGVAELWLDRN